MKKLILIAAAGLLVAALVVAGCGGDQTQMQNDAKTQAESQAQPAADNMAKTAEATDANAVKPYPLDYCIVSGEKLGEMGDPVVKTYNGQEIKFCCNMCVPKFEANPAMFLAKLDSAAAGVDMSGAMDHDHM